MFGCLWLLTMVIVMGFALEIFSSDSKYLPMSYLGIFLLVIISAVFIFDKEEPIYKYKCSTCWHGWASRRTGYVKCPKCDKTVFKKIITA